MKDYIIEYEQRSQAEQDFWSMRHPTLPCPPRPKRVHFRKLDRYKVLAARVTRQPGYQVTLQDVEDFGFISSKVAQAIYTDLRKNKDMNTMEVQHT
ncbi:MAG: hypothetical protein WB755_12260 [Terriglobales bacterium]|jgi:hypothetical protein